MKGLLVLAALGIVVLAGCGGSSTSAVEQAVKSSPLTYYHFSNEAWWGRPVTVQTDSVTGSSSSANAELSVRAGSNVIATERVHLDKTGGKWAVSGAEVPTAGGDAQGFFGLVSGPKSTRKPTAAEQAAVDAAGLRAFPGEGDCLRFMVAVSSVDPAYAAVTLRYVGPNRIRCATSGNLFFGAPKGTWRMISASSVAFPCSDAPAGVLRTLYGECAITK